MQISQAQKHQAGDIARLIMQAMNDDCCQYFAGRRHTLKDFECMMRGLVLFRQSQYSYRNTLVALNDDGQVAGICVSYDGKDLHRLRQAFIDAAKEAFGLDYSGMDDETQAGELYIDSLAVCEQFRHQGVATSLIKATVDKAAGMNIPAVGLLVDQGNPKAEHLYSTIGFKYINDSTWGGHKMKHLQLPII